MIVLSHFCQNAPGSLVNHRQYAQLHGYRHEIVDASGMSDRLSLRLFYRYEVLLSTLRHAQPDECILLLSENAAIVEPLAFTNLLGQREWLLVRTGSHSLPQVDVQFWRNTQRVRDIVLGIVRKCRLGGEPVMSEAELFEGLESQSCMVTMDGFFPVRHAGYNYNPKWASVPTFAISIDDCPETPRNKDVCARYREVLVGHVNRQRAAGRPMFSFPWHAGPQAAERSTYNPGRAIALMTLYTPSIGIYARISECNFRRYCEAHGYTLYVHRDVPPEVGLDACGNWYKPWLLLGYLQHHEWVFWLDADILVSRQELPLEPMLEQRDYVLAHDAGQWPFNSGVMGFRRTDQNDALLREVMTDVAALADRSSVYAGGGDQSCFMKALARAGLPADDAVLDLVALNTPWRFRRPDSFMVHYYGMWPEMRAMMMAHDEMLLES
jgi:hypothetical protein